MLGASGKSGLQYENFRKTITYRRIDMRLPGNRADADSGRGFSGSGDEHLCGKGILPNVFMVYGIVTYGIIAVLYLLIEKNLSGHRLIKGLKYGASCCAVWIVYLLEPLSHVSPIDKITYPLADSAALLVMGLLLGLLLTSDGPQAKNKSDKTRSWRDYLCITSCFIGGRLVLYFAFDIYSSFKTHDLQTLLWTLLTGIVLSVVVIWYEKHLAGQGKLEKTLLADLNRHHVLSED